MSGLCYEQALVNFDLRLNNIFTYFTFYNRPNGAIYKKSTKSGIVKI